MSDRPTSGIMKRIDGKLVYIPVQGPRIKQIRSGRKTNTGVQGICFVTSSNRPDYRRYDYFYARIGNNRSVRFNISTLGREEAWERALRCRAKYEREVIASNAAIMAARSGLPKSLQSSAFSLAHS